MSITSRQENWLLFIGDIVAFFVALWLTLLVRYGGLPNSDIFNQHLQPFSILFIIWFLVFYIAGLYEKHTVILKNRLPSLLLKAQIANTIIAVLFFYFIPYFGITPKTNLFIYLVISFALILVWRIYGQALLGFRHKQNALLIGSGAEMKELREEVNNNSRYSIHFISSIDLDAVDKLDFKEEILNPVYSEGVSIIAVDLKSEKVSPILPHLYNLIYSKVRFVDMYRVYEDIFDRVPLSLLRHTWFLENISLAPKFTYDFLKRAMDLVLAVIIGFLTLILLPFVWLAVRLDDAGPLFFYQERVGKNNKPIRIVKFRTMKYDSEGKNNNSKKEVTRVGRFLRPTRIDELPQFWNVLKGDVSMIGPRPEVPELAKIYEKEISYYNVRHLIKPGLAGWAQIYHEDPPKFDPDLSKTRRKLSYDLYYIKNRSFLIDLKITLHTIRELVSRSGV